MAPSDFGRPSIAACGCDGVSYTDDCAAHEGGIAVAHAGYCTTP